MKCYVLLVSYISSQTYSCINNDLSTPHRPVISEGVLIIFWSLLKARTNEVSD